MTRDTVDMLQLVSRLRRCLTPDLLHPKYRTQSNPVSGHCYVASEALYYLLGGMYSGLKPMQVHHEGTSHWYLQDKTSEEIIDITADQFKTPVPYQNGKGRGFLTKGPSKRAMRLLQAFQKS